MRPNLPQGNYSTRVHLTSNDTFALYSLPDDADHFLIRQYTNTLQPFNAESVNQEGFVFYPFEETLASPSIFILKEAFLKNPIIRFVSKHKGVPICISKYQYLNTVKKFIAATQQTHQKIIYSRIKPFLLDTDNLFELFITLKEIYSKAFVYLVNIPSIGCWMGASPEIFLKKKRDTIQTVALAGTQRDLGLPLEMVHWRKKEIEEQGFVSQYIENILNNMGINYQKTLPKTVRAGSVLHLKTNFKFKLKKGFYALIKALHPTPAVCGIPKQAAKRFILQSEAHQRDYYTGFLGPFNIRQSTNLFVNLRCMQVFKDKFVLYVGGGITKDSTPLAEWHETEMKAQTLENVIERIYLTPIFA